MTRAASLAVEIFTGFSVAPARRKKYFPIYQQQKEEFCARIGEKKFFFLFLVVRCLLFSASFWWEQRSEVKNQTSLVDRVIIDNRRERERERLETRFEQVSHLASEPSSWWAFSWEWPLVMIACWLHKFRAFRLGPLVGSRESFSLHIKNIKKPAKNTRSVIS